MVQLHRELGDTLTIKQGNTHDYHKQRFQQGVNKYAEEEALSWFRVAHRGLILSVESRQDLKHAAWPVRQTSYQVLHLGILPLAPHSTVRWRSNFILQKCLRRYPPRSVWPQWLLMDTQDVRTDGSQSYSIFAFRNYVLQRRGCKKNTSFGR